MKNTENATIPMSGRRYVVFNPRRLSGNWSKQLRNEASRASSTRTRAKNPISRFLNPSSCGCNMFQHELWHSGLTLPLRQEKSWKGEWKRNLKPFEAIQRVRPPPGRGAARQPEASLAWETATSLVKRRQQMLKPCVSLEIEYPLGPSVWVSRGRCRQDR